MTKREFRKAVSWGRTGGLNSVYVNVPAEFLIALGIENGTNLCMDLDTDTIVLRNADVETYLERKPRRSEAER